MGVWGRYQRPQFVGNKDDKSLRKQQKAPGRGGETWSLGHSERISVLLCACIGYLGLVRTRLLHGSQGQATLTHMSKTLLSQELLASSILLSSSYQQALHHLLVFQLKAEHFLLVEQTASLPISLEGTRNFSPINQALSAGHDGPTSPTDTSRHGRFLLLVL